MFKIGDRIECDDSRYVEMEAIVIDINVGYWDDIRIRVEKCPEIKTIIGLEVNVQSRYFTKISPLKDLKKFINSLSENVKH